MQDKFCHRAIAPRKRAIINKMHAKEERNMSDNRKIKKMLATSSRIPKEGSEDVPLGLSRIQEEDESSFEDTASVDEKSDRSLSQHSESIDTLREPVVCKSKIEFDKYYDSVLEPAIENGVAKDFFISFAPEFIEEMREDESLRPHFLEQIFYLFNSGLNILMQVVVADSDAAILFDSKNWKEKLVAVWPEAKAELRVILDATTAAPSDATVMDEKKSVSKKESSVRVNWQKVPYGPCRNKADFDTLYDRLLDMRSDDDNLEKPIQFEASFIEELRHDPAARAHLRLQLNFLFAEWEKSAGIIIKTPGAADIKITSESWPNGWNALRLDSKKLKNSGQKTNKLFQDYGNDKLPENARPSAVGKENETPLSHTFPAIKRKR